MWCAYVHLKGLCGGGGWLQARGQLCESGLSVSSCMAVGTSHSPVMAVGVVMEVRFGLGP